VSDDELIIVNDASPVDVATRPEQSLTLLVVPEGISRSALHEQARQYVDGGAVAMVMVREATWLESLRGRRSSARPPVRSPRSSDQHQAHR
jgi:hypothetical protein